MKSGKYSRNKGLRGEQEICKRLGLKRVGVAYAENPIDGENTFCQVQVKNKCLGGSAMLTCLEAMPKDRRNQYVIFKARAGSGQRKAVWLVVETIEQHELDHIGKMAKCQP